MATSGLKKAVEQIVFGSSDTVSPGSIDLGSRFVCSVTLLCMLKGKLSIKITIISYLATQNVSVLDHTLAQAF